MATTRERNGETNGSKKKRPVFVRKYFPVEVAVFEFTNDERLNHSVNLMRTFRRDEESDWETTSFLTASDLLPAAKLLGEAYSFIQGRLQQAYEQGRHAPAEELAGSPQF